jgi:hypothetical protein
MEKLIQKFKTQKELKLLKILSTSIRLRTPCCLKVKEEFIQERLKEVAKNGN